MKLSILQFYFDVLQYLCQHLRQTHSNLWWDKAYLLHHAPAYSAIEHPGVFDQILYNWHPTLLLFTQFSTMSLLNSENENKPKGCHFEMDSKLKKFKGNYGRWCFTLIKMEFQGVFQQWRNYSWRSVDVSGRELLWRRL